MTRPDRLRALLSREQWATVLVIAGGSLLLVPPNRAGPGLVLWVVGVLITAFVVVLIGSRARRRFRE